MQEYKGPIQYNTNKDKRVQVASQCFKNQVARCCNKKNPRYKDNGAKGYTVEYTLRQFIAWYLIEIEKFTGTRPSVGRIDHSKGYFFGNIQIESLADNSMERINRVGPTKPRRKVEIYKDGVFQTVADSGKAAAAMTGVHSSHIPRYCSGKLKQSVKGYSFKYHEAKDESAA